MLTDAEARLIIDAIPDHYRLLIRVLLATGMRWGEATALKVSDLDLGAETASVRISRAWRRGGDDEETAVLRPTKTRKSKRTVALAGGIADQLRDHVAGRQPDDFVFVNGLGTPVKHPDGSPVMITAISSATRAGTAPCRRAASAPASRPFRIASTRSPSRPRASRSIETEPSIPSEFARSQEKSPEP